MSLSLDFISKECKNNNHSLCKYLWEGLGFQIVCNCECHDKKIVLGKMRSYLTHLIHHLRGMENMVIINKIPKDKDFFPSFDLEDTNALIIDEVNVNGS
jgi:hypothetical protein